MKTQNFKILSLFTICLTMLFFAGCKPDAPNTPCQPINYFYEIPSAERPVFIYKGGEKLTFVRHPQLDTLVFTSNKLDSGYNTTSTQQDCPIQYNRKWVGITFKGINNALNSSVRASITVDDLGTNLSDIFVVYSPSGVDISFYIDTWGYLNPNYWNTLIVNNKTYTKVRTLTPYSQAPPGKAAFYDRDSGIVKIEFSDSLYFELLKKE